jgi:hypothetical protein
MADFIRLLCRLADARVNFILVGGMAAATHGCSLVTQDLDLCLDFSAANLLRLQSSLQDLHPVHRMTAKRIPFDHDESSLADFKNLYLQTDWGPLDCLGEILGLGNYHAALIQSEEFTVAGRPCRILTLEAIIKAKEAMNRPRDKEAVRQLYLIRELKNKPNPKSTD